MAAKPANNARLSALTYRFVFSSALTSRFGGPLAETYRSEAFLGKTNRFATRVKEEHVGLRRFWAKAIGLRCGRGRTAAGLRLKRWLGSQREPRLDPQREPRLEPQREPRLESRPDRDRSRVSGCERIRTWDRDRIRTWDRDRSRVSGCEWIRTWGRGCG